MTANEQQEAFSHDLSVLIDRYRDEFDLSYASVVGVLGIKLVLLAVECAEESQGEPHS